MTRPGVIAGLASLCLAACGGAGGGAGDGLAVVVSAPVTSPPWIARSITQGAKLAVDDVNARGGVVVGAKHEKLALQVLDNGGWPAMAPADAITASRLADYVSVNLVVEALDEVKQLGAPLMRMMNTTHIVGANGDGRGYNAGYHEGISPSDMYFAKFRGFTFVPVDDDPLSGSLPVVPQLGP